MSEVISGAADGGRDAGQTVSMLPGNVWPVQGNDHSSPRFQAAGGVYGHVWSGATLLLQQKELFYYK